MTDLGNRTRSPASAGRRGAHALVIGAGIGGLLAAAAVADAYEHVVVVDRDTLPDGEAPRRAVPQGSHVHGLQPSGQHAIERLLPGITAELLAAGAVPYQLLGQLRFQVAGHWLARGDMGCGSVLASRPFIEGHVRRRVRAIDNVTLLDRTDALELTAGLGARRITGARVCHRHPGSRPRELLADLVVVATGRGGRVPAWLQAVGATRPREQRLPVDVGYSSLPLRLPAGALEPDKFVVVGPRPDQPRTLALFAQEHDTWLLTVGGYRGQHPPTDVAELLAFAAPLAPTDVLAAIRAGQPAGGVSAYRFAANVRRYYERLRALPAGFVPLGDALCAFNPVYGQGMSVAALQAIALRDAVAADRVAPQWRYLCAASRIVDPAWQLTAAADLALPTVPGPRPVSTRAINAYLRRLLAAAEHDPDLAATFLRVITMLDPPTALLHPMIIRRTLRRRRPRTPPPDVHEARRLDDGSTSRLHHD